MPTTVLITGGAGFIGSHLTDLLIEEGYQVRILDNFSEQVHPTGPPAYLNAHAELISGDIRDPAAVEKALEGVEIVYHLAAAVGVGQSMYQIADYTSVNNQGTARLLEALIQKPPRRLIVASSMSIYGEGYYLDAHKNRRGDVRRSLAQLKRAQWEALDEEGRALTPIPTTEEKPPDLGSVYALSKFDQERLCLMIGQTYGVETVALRFFNVYGPRQALSNPYTGVMAIFGSRLLNERAPLIFEDGMQRRDFVHVSDVAQACLLAMHSAEAPGQVFNIGSGRAFSVCEVAQAMGRAMGRESIEPEITREFRAGDIRHCFADISRARALLGFTPQTSFEQGLEELTNWLASQRPDDHVDRAHRELTARGLTLKS